MPSLHPTIDALIARGAMLYNNDVIKYDQGRKLFFGRYNPVGQSFELSPYGAKLMQQPELSHGITPKHTETITLKKRKG